MTSYDADVIVIGGGIVGASTAWQLTQRYPGISVLLLEKEAQLAAHQTGHNSGVVHAGVYYAPGSLKAQFCREGSEATYRFSREQGLRVQQCGKLIVATSPLEVERLGALQERAVRNDLAPERLDAAALRAIEPNIEGLAAILVRRSGIADYPAITARMAALAEQDGAEIRLGTEVTGMREDANGVTVETSAGTVRSRHAIVCGGLMADRLATMCGVPLDFRIIPFRGEYFVLPDAKRDIVSHLIYPVPDPDLPFLGVHLTRMIDGSVTVGPNAILALAREGYRWRDVDAGDLAGTLAFPGFWKMLAANSKATMAELWGSLSRRRYLDLCRKYCPQLELADLTPYPAGVRAQAVLRDGTLVHDFLIKRSARSLHVCNAPSPAATAAIPIGAHLVAQFGDFTGRPAAA